MNIKTFQARFPEKLPALIEKAREYLALDEKFHNGGLTHDEQARLWALRREFGIFNLNHSGIVKVAGYEVTIEAPTPTADGARAIAEAWEAGYMEVCSE